METGRRTIFILGRLSKSRPLRLPPLGESFLRQVKMQEKTDKGVSHKNSKLFSS